jgi:hypothetical protein
VGRDESAGAANRISIKKSSTAAGRALADSYNKTHPIVGALRRFLVSSIAQQDAGRVHDKLHPSDMSKKYWCPRRSWYLINGERGETVDVSHYLAAILEEGTEIHGKYQRWFRQMGILEGDWYCAECEYKWWALAPEECANCRSTNFVYAEVTIDIPDLFADGHADGILHSEGKRTGLEIKSIGLRSVEMEQPALYRRYKSGELGLMEMWRSIRMPFGSHLKQGQIYLHGWQQHEETADIDTMTFLYEFKANQDVRAWTVKYNSDVIKPLVPGAQAVKRAIETGGRVKHPVWADATHPECKACPFLAPCEP